jgi:hypothetical protein
VQPTQIDSVVDWYATLDGAALGGEFSGPRFLRPYHFALLATAALRRGAQHVGVPQSLEGYAARMRLWQSIGFDAPARVNERNPGGRFHPLTPITSEESAEACADAVKSVFKSGGTRDRRTLDSVGIMLSEIFGNCHFHSSAAGGIRGLACAQTWPAGDLAQVAVADTGIGIRSSLSANPNLADELERCNATELATRLGVTGKPMGQHSGYGLTVARELMEQARGRLIVLSGSEGFLASESGHRSMNLRCNVAGTVVIMEWRLSTPLDTRQVYGGWPDAGGDANDFF